MLIPSLGFLFWGLLLQKKICPPSCKKTSTSDEGKFVCKVDDCNATYTNEYNLIRHLQVKHDIFTKLSKFGHSSTWDEGLRH
jgi:hypothetical protein